MAVLHFLTFLQFYTGWFPTALIEELAEASLYYPGLFCLAVDVTLGRDSPHCAVRRRMRGNWQRLHRLVYPAADLACLHLLWQARSDVGDALIYLAIFAALLVWRVQAPEP